MNPRRLNCLIHILKPQERKDQDTGEKIIEYKPHHRKVPSSKEGTSGGSSRRGLQVEETVKTIFTIRYIEDLKADFRVEIYEENSKGEELEIVTILDRNGDKQWLEVHCSEVA